MRVSFTRSAAVSCVFVLVALCAIAGCGTARDVSTPRKALLGHWRNVIPGSGTDQFYSEKAVTYSGKGSDYRLAYTVIEENLSKFTLLVTFGAQTSTSRKTEVVFSKDRKTMDLLPGNIPEKLQYVYVDSREVP